MSTTLLRLKPNPSKTSSHRGSEMVPCLFCGATLPRRFSIRYHHDKCYQHFTKHQYPGVNLGKRSREDDLPPVVPVVNVPPVNVEPGPRQRNPALYDRCTYPLDKHSQNKAKMSIQGVSLHSLGSIPMRVCGITHLRKLEERTSIIQTCRETIADRKSVV